MSSQGRHQVIGIRLWVFRVVLLLPLLFLLTLFGTCALHLARIRGVHGGETVEQVSAHLRHKPGERYELGNRDGVAGVWYQDRAFFQPLEAKPGEKRILALGGSSLVTPPGKGFPEIMGQLAQRDGLPWRVINAGINGFSSFSVRNRLVELVRQSPPDLVLIYSGHNDYLTAYRNYLLPNFYLVTGNPLLEGLARIAYHLGEQLRQKQETYILPFGFTDYLAVVLEPGLFKLLGNTLGWYEDRRQMFSRADKAILSGFKLNMQVMIEACEKQGVPVLIVTPVSNLHVPPIGVDSSAQELYERGLAAASYEQRIKLLEQARDEDTFSGLTRVKSPLIKYLRGIHAPPSVWVYQLDQDLYRHKQPLDGTQFSDVFHLLPVFHKVVAGHIYRFILEQGVLADKN
jgi:hypothetical protein